MAIDARPSHRRDAAGSPGPTVLQELWNSGLWRLLPILLFGITPTVMVLPFMPSILTNFFAGRAAGDPSLSCESFDRGLEPPACVDAHSTVVMWQSWTSFASQSVLSFVINPLVGSVSDVVGRVPFLLLAQVTSLLPLLALLFYAKAGFSLLWIFPTTAVSAAFSTLTVSLPYAADLTTPANRPKVFGVLLAMPACAFLLGPILAAAIGDAMRTLYASLAIMVAVVVATAVLPESLPPERVARATVARVVTGWYAGPPGKAGRKQTAWRQSTGQSRDTVEDEEALLPDSAGGSSARLSDAGGMSGDVEQPSSTTTREAPPLALEAEPGGAPVEETLDERPTHAPERQSPAVAGTPSQAPVGLGHLARAFRVAWRSKLFRMLTLITMLQGMCLEGLQDLLMQYFEMRVSFTSRDQALLFIVLGTCGILSQMALLPALMRVATEQHVLALGLLASTVHMVMLVFTTNYALAYSGLVVGSLAMLSFPSISSIKSRNVEQAEQGAVQGALFGARALANGVGPLVFAKLFSLFTRSDRPGHLPYFPGAPFVLGAACMATAFVLTLFLPRGAHSRPTPRDAPAHAPAHHDRQA